MPLDFGLYNVVINAVLKEISGHTGLFSYLGALKYIKKYQANRVKFQVVF